VKSTVTNRPVTTVLSRPVVLQDLYVALPVPEQLKSGGGEGAASFAFLEKELRFSQM
jgi:hypothetical protein